MGNYPQVRINTHSTQRIATKSVTKIVGESSITNMPLVGDAVGAQALVCIRIT